MAAVIENEGKFLVVEEAQNNQAVINQPAGHLEDGESLHDAIIREVFEETAWQFEPEAVIGLYRWTNPDSGHTYLRVCFTGTARSHDPQQALDDNILGAKWLGLDDILTMPLRSPMVKRCFEDYLSGIRYPLSFCNDLV
ncbi:NUDIX hydrolase [Kaarinaea lacus]